MKQAILATAHDTEVAMIMVNTYKGAQRFQIGQELIATGAFVEGTTGGITTAASGVAVAVGGALICDSVSKVGLVAQATKIATGDYDKLKGASNPELKEVYNSIKEAPQYPEGFQARQNGTRKVKINNQQLLEELRKIEPGEWKKVYKDGFDINGNKISIHYFQSKTGKVFNVKVKPGWSN